MPSFSPGRSGEDRTRPAGETVEARIAKVLAHPLRGRILQRLGERVASPADLAAELGAPLGVVSYHVRMLRDYDCVELVRTEPRRGTLRHFYRANRRAEPGHGAVAHAPCRPAQATVGPDAARTRRRPRRGGRRRPLRGP